jgi:hypothetical protein
LSKKNSLVVGPCRILILGKQRRHSKHEEIIGSGKGAFTFQRLVRTRPSKDKNIVLENREVR